MNLGYDISQALPGMRAEAESRMTETVTIGRFEQVQIPGSLVTDLTLVETFYTGVARVKFPYATSLSKVSAGQQLAETSIIVSVPHETQRIPTGSMIRVDASAADATLVGRMFTVDGQAQAGQTTAHRYPVVEES